MGASKLLFGCVFILVSASCATTRPDAAAGADFRVQGRIGVRDGDRAFSASFDWLQAGERYEIEFWGPFGQGRTHLSGDARGARVVDGRGRPGPRTAPEALMGRELGWSAPVSVLRHWVLGGYDPGEPVTAERRDDDGVLLGFEQAGWVVEVSRWRESERGPVPGRVVATRGERRISVVCQRWWFA